MKRYFLLAVGVAILLSMAINLQPIKAQVYGEFDTIRVVTASYTELTQKNILNADWFALPPTFRPTDHDDGYFRLTLDFAFEFNSEVYRDLWININGFIMFTPSGTYPPLVAPNNQKALFVQSNSYPTNVVAPFWGDHYYRTNEDKTAGGYKPSEISWFESEDTSGKKILTIQWKDLNINDKRLKSSIANFQVILYESHDPYSPQGDIAFAYGPVGGNPDTLSGNTVVTRGATVGLKGDGADFMNALVVTFPSPNDNPFFYRSDTSVTNLWPPTGATDRRFYFTALRRFNIEETWGDGDADFSKAEGRKHFGMPQNRYVTVSDARKIMRSVATNIPLDSVRRRDAYHGDVNHNGRYYYDNQGVRTDIPWRNKNYWDSLPPGVNSVKRIFYQVTEYDASMILDYIAARVVELPWWVHDTVVIHGKINPDMTPATGIRFGKASLIEDNYQIPVYINGYSKGRIAFKFDVNADILSVTTSEDLINETSNRTVVIAGSGEFDETQPVCFITLRKANEDVTFSKIRFNDENLADIKFNLSEINSLPADGEVLSQNAPNPFNGSTWIQVNLKEAGHYTLAIYDVLGNKIKTIASGNLSSNSYEWNGTDDSGAKVQEGVYVYRLTGDNVSISRKLVVSR